MARESGGRNQKAVWSRDAEEQRRHVEDWWHGRRPDAWDAGKVEEEEEAVKEEMCRLIPLKALILSAGSNYYQRARNKGSASG